ncbi:MAG: hypothetical protein DMD33_00875 [Gemmatimonadetes bacterium]|nr:MAG: hypothetical protein DMD33_00875 [Gemmatimonadota bacterium]
MLVHLGDARRLKRWREKAVDAIAAAYLAFKIDDATALSELAELALTGDAAGRLLALWGKERRYTVRSLTAAQVKKAYTRGLLSRPAALEELAELHYTSADANLLLDE